MKNTKSHSIEEMANKLKKLKTKKVKLDESIEDIQSQLDETLKTLGINQKIIYRDVYPTINPIIYNDNIDVNLPINFTSPLTFDL